jgi:hypothetical protein
MVNLLLTGKAISNTFDDVIELDSGGDTKVPLFPSCMLLYFVVVVVKKVFPLLEYSERRRQAK